jgi:hypothetical protein
MTDQVISAPVSNEIAVASPISSVTSSEVSSFDVSKYFSEDLRKDPDFERLSKNIPNDPNALVKDLYHKTKHFGKVKETMRAELEAEFNKPTFYKEEDYGYDLPQDYSIEDELLNTAKSKANELGIKPEQFKDLMESLFQADAQIKSQEMETQKKAEEEAIGSLKAEWGSDYDKRAATAEKMLQFLSSPEDDVKIEALPAEAKVILAKLMEKVSQKINEPTVGKLSSPAQTKMSESDFHAQISEIRSDKMLTPNEKENKVAKLYGDFYSKEDIKKEFSFIS